MTLTSFGTVEFRNLCRKRSVTKGLDSLGLFWIKSPILAWLKGIHEGLCLTEGALSGADEQ